MNQDASQLGLASRIHRMEWKISDGTVVHLGGEIEGTGPVAQRLLADLERMAADRLVRVDVAPQPGGSEPLDLDNALHVNAWVFDAVRWVDGAEVVEQPELDFPEPAEFDEKVVY